MTDDYNARGADGRPDDRPPLGRSMESGQMSQGGLETPRSAPRPFSPKALGEEGPLVAEDPMIERLQQRRQSKISSFQLQLDLDDEFGALPDAAGEIRPLEELPREETVRHPAPPEEQPLGGYPDLRDTAVVPLEETVPAVPVPSPERGSANRKHQRRLSPASWGWIKGVLYVIAVLASAGVLSFLIITGGVDFMGLNKSSAEIEVILPQGVDEKQLTAILEEKGIIDQPMMFRLYMALSKRGSQLKPGKFILSPNFGYKEILSTIQNGPRREIVRVVIPEGFTLEKIAQRLESNGVCSAEELYKAVNKTDYDYDFVREIPTESDDPKYKNRVYFLDGYLFPDTYDFYQGSSGEEVVKVFLDNFDLRFDTTLKTAMRQKGFTINDVVILASIIQGEVAQNEDMLKVSRVFQNRLSNPSLYPKLQSYVTTRYSWTLPQEKDGVPIDRSAYDTNQCEGLPVGPINNPGMVALRAVIFPSTNPDVAKCYYFATDTSTGTTYYSKTLAEHQAICRKYNISEEYPDE